MRDAGTGFAAVVAPAIREWYPKTYGGVTMKWIEAAALTACLVLPAAKLPAQAVEYELEPVRGAPVVDLRVRMTFPGEPAGQTRLFLPRDRFGVRAMYRYVVDARVLPPARLLARDDSTLSISHAPGARVSVRYTVRFDSAQAGFVAYGPSIGPRHYHVLGSQWMARVGDPDSVRPYSVRVGRGNLGGTVAGSFGLRPGVRSLTTRFSELEWTVVAGGAWREDRFTCGGRPVATLLNGAFQVPDDTIFRMARAIVCGERELFADTTQPFYSAMITARQNLRAGASYIDAFSAFVRPESRASQVALLLAHEVMHDWLPRRLRLVPGADEPAPLEFSSFHDVRYDWFHEGFTEYLARRVLVRTGLATDDWFAERLNDDLRTLATHPYRSLPASGLEAAARAGTYTNLHQRISYHRGTVLAFNWDAAVRRASGGKADLVDVVRRLLAEAAATGGRIERPRFERVISEFGIPAGDVARHALGGEPIPVDSTGMGPGWVLRTRMVPLADAGFDVPVSTVSHRAAGVDPGGAAYAAGLRDGMPIVRIDNPPGADPNAAPDAPVTVVVRDGQAERSLAIVPRVAQVAELHFERRP